MLTTNTLPVRKTTTSRSYAYLVCTNPTEIQDGTLTVNEDTGVRVRRTTTRSYLISEQTPQGPHRVFLIVKDSDQGRADLKAGIAGRNRVGEVYECRVAVRAGHPTLCTCKAGSCGMSCVHAESLSDLVANGSIPSPLDSGCERAQPSKCSADLDAF